MQSQQEQQLIYQRVSNEQKVAEILQPFTKLERLTREDFEKMDKKYLMLHGRFKRRLLVKFEVSRQDQLRVPVQAVVEQILPWAQVFVLFQWQTNSNLFDMMIAMNEYVASTSLVQATQQFIQLMLASPHCLLSFSVYKTSGNKFNNEQLVKYLVPHTGYNLIHQLIMIQQQCQPIVMKKSGGQASSGPFTGLDNSGNGAGYFTGGNRQKSVHELESQSVVILDKGGVFNVSEFSKGCIKVMENLILFTQDPQIRGIQLETNPQVQVAKLRMLDHRPIIQRLWHETVQFTVKRSKNPSLIQIFTQEQTAALYHRYKEQIDKTFNQFVMQNATQIVQPHPIRALIDQVLYLQTLEAFDIGLYDCEQYGLNFLVACYFVGKNFLVNDQAMTSNHGAICLAGCPGSGKSRIGSVLQRFFNGFSLQDSGKGITEFQNFDIVSKSFIRAEEVELRKLSSATWKQLADIEVTIKCRVKNQDDVEVTKNCPVVITTNCSVFEQIISKLFKDNSFGAVHRRWIFIRYFKSWSDAHAALFDDHLQSLTPEFNSIYQNHETDGKVFNSLIGLALLFPVFQFAIPEYILPYYVHALKTTASTVMGITVMLHFQKINTLIQQISRVYCYGQDSDCMSQQQKLGGTLKGLLEQTMFQLVNNFEFESGQLLEGEVQILMQSATPLYVKICCLRQSEVFNAYIKEYGYKLMVSLLKEHSKKNGVYTQILSYMQIFESVDLGPLEFYQMNTEKIDDLDDSVMAELDKEESKTPPPLLAKSHSELNPEEFTCGRKLVFAERTVFLDSDSSSSDSDDSSALFKQSPSFPIHKN